MRHPPIYTSWIITCHSSEGVQAVRNWLSDRIQLDRVIADMVRTYPEGVEQVQAVPHRLGDYFAAIRMLPVSTAAPSSVRLVFRKLPEAGRCWKDLMASILEEIKASPEVTSVALDYKGDEEARPMAESATMTNRANRSRSEFIGEDKG